MAKIAETLEDVVGSDCILPPTSLDLPEYLSPEAIAYPTTEAELSAVMACAHGQGWRVIACGSGSKLAWGGLGTGVDLVVSTARLNRVIDHAVGDMTLTAQAGVTLADLVPRLAQHHQFLAVDPAYPDRATLGGLVATADTGSLRQRYGGLRDLVIGISFVRYDGQIAKAGGRVVKNVAGYDLMKLLTGSYGTLGIISQLTFRLHPVQEASKTVVVTGEGAGVEAFLSDLRLSPLTPVALDVLSPGLTRHLGHGDNLALLARFQAIAPGVEEQVSSLMAMVGAGLSAQVLEGATEAQLWTAAREALFPSTKPSESALVAKVGIAPAQAVAWLRQLPGDALTRIHAGSGLSTVRLEQATPETVDALRASLNKVAGTQSYLTLLEAPASVKAAVDVWGYDGNALGVMGAIKAQFDPHHRLSPGRFVLGDRYTIRKAPPQNFNR